MNLLPMNSYSRTILTELIATATVNTARAAKMVLLLVTTIAIRYATV